MNDDPARAAAEAAVRSAYGKLIASLAARGGDIAAAEDALSDAFAAALRAWPQEGVPERPEAWLLTVARRRLLDGHRRAAVRRAAEPDLLTLTEDAVDHVDPDALPDRRLELLFVCAHPAIDPGVRTPLMLQTVLGLDAERIAGAFLVSPPAMAQRLVRAKRKIAAAKIPFAIPGRGEIAGRLEAVLDAIYAAYAAAHDAAPAGETGASLAAEALFLARLVSDLAPGAGEAAGLLALVHLTEARRPARRDAAGRFVPLAEQDVALWSAEHLAAGETALRRALARAAAAGEPPGRFTLEAAIAAAHAARRVLGATPWADIVQLYDALIRIAPALGAQIARAAALAEAGAPAAALAALDGLHAANADRLANHQPYWATRAHVLARLGQPGAADAYDRAIALTEDAAVRAWLEERRG